MIDWKLFVFDTETELTDSAYSRIYGRLPIPRSYVPITAPSRAAYYGEWDWTSFQFFLPFTSQNHRHRNNAASSDGFIPYDVHNKWGKGDDVSITLAYLFQPALNVVESNPSWIVCLFFFSLYFLFLVLACYSFFLSIFVICGSAAIIVVSFEYSRSLAWFSRSFSGPNLV